VAASFTQIHLTRALKGVAKAGFVPARAEIDSAGKIVIILREPSAESVDGSPLDDWRDHRGSRQN
jgi:hypothetical protein